MRYFVLISFDSDDPEDAKTSIEALAGVTDLIDDSWIEALNILASFMGDDWADDEIETRARLVEATEAFETAIRKKSA